MWLAQRIGISELACGATIVSFGTTLPEAAVSTYASWSGHPELALGNALGSCMANGALILGVSVVLAGFTRAGPDFRRRCLQLLLVSAGIFVVSRHGALGRLASLVLLLVMIWSTASALRSTNDGRVASRPAESLPGEEHEKGGQVLRLLAGSLMIALGSRLLVGAATQLAAGLGVSESVIGLSLVAVGTSLPELATAVTAGARAHGQLALGNVLGANFLNLTLVLGLAGVIRPVPVDQIARTSYLPIFALLTLALWAMAKWRRGFGRFHGAILLGAYALYIMSLWR